MHRLVFRVTGLCALAPSPETFGVLRFLAGLGLGGVLPSATALAGEFAPMRVRNLAYAFVFTGFPGGQFGGVSSRSCSRPRSRRRCMSLMVV